MSDTTNTDYQPTDQDVQILREWLKKMPHIVQDYDDKFLAVFIQGRKGSLQKAKIVLEKFSSYPLRFPEFLDHLDIFHPITQKCLEEAMLFPLPKRLDGAQVFVITSDCKDTESKKAQLIEIWNYWLMCFLVLCWEDNPYTRVLTIFDWKNLSLGHAREITPVFVARLFEAVKCTPIRVQAVYFVNVPPALGILGNMIKSAVKKKLADRFHFISSMETLHQYFPREILPKEYGGYEDDNKTMHNRWKKTVESYRDRLIEEYSKIRKLDPLRPKETDALDIGTFKGLKVD